MPSLNHQTKVRRIRALISCTPSLFVGVRRRKVIRKLSRPLFNLALVVGFVVVLVFFGHGFGFVDGVCDTNQRAPGDAGEGVAGGADFAVDLEATAEGLVVEGL